MRTDPAAAKLRAASCKDMTACRQVLNNWIDEREGVEEIRRTEGENEENLPDILFAWKAKDTAV